jgi:phosphoglycerate dehydrogenase-like enzyme
VYTEEPLPVDHPLRSLRNVFLTPHIAGDNLKMFARCARQAIEYLQRWPAEES